MAHLWAVVVIDGDGGYLPGKGLNYMAGRLTPPLVDKYSYLFKDILCSDPQKAFKFCRELQDQWNSEFAKDHELAKSMATWKKNKAIHLVSASDKFDKSPPDLKTYALLSAPYDELMVEGDHNPDVEPPKPPKDSDADGHRDSDAEPHKPPKDSDAGGHRDSDAEPPKPSKDSDAGGHRDSDAEPPKLSKDSDADGHRGSERQQKQHLDAYVILMKSMGSDQPLSEDLIKRVHTALMKNLRRDGKMINSGQYRCYAVSAGDHNFIDHESVPSCMSKLVKEYNDKFGGEHHPFELAGWLLMEMLQIHPFEDGNGRISRLLWCYSLQKDRLPFPVIPFPGLHKAYRQYIRCIDRDQDCCMSGGPYKHMTSLTLISITKSWKNYLSNLRFENEKKFQIIASWLKESDNNLEDAI